MVTFCPDDIVVSPTLNQPFFVTWEEPEVVDNSGAAPSVVQNLYSGIFVRVDSVIPIMYRFTDAAGNFALCEFTVTGKGESVRCKMIR